MPATNARPLPTATLVSRSRSALLFSDRLALAGFALALLFLAIHPSGVGGIAFDMFTATKHIPMFILVTGILLTFVGRGLEMRPPPVPGVGRIAWPLALVAFLITVGGAYLRFFRHDNQSFLFMGWYMLLFLPVAAWLVRSADPLRAVRIATLWIVSVSLFMGLFQIPYRTYAPFHELEFLFIPAMTYYLFAARKKTTLLAGLVLLTLWTVFSDKNTGYLAGLVSGAYLLWFKGLPWFRQRAPFARILTAYVTTLLGIAIILAAAFLLIYRNSYLPSGNPEYRMHTYEMMLGRFHESPLWGNLYTVPSVDRFTLFNTGRGNNELPTHSGILDILGNGGLLGISLWFFGLAAIGVVAYRHVLSPRLPPTPYTPYAHTLAAISLAAIMTYGFNPILLEPVKALTVWFPLGLLLGIAAIARNTRKISAWESR